MKREIEVIARGACVKEGHVLLCHTKGARNTYLPGGHVEFEEQANCALEREICEELGVLSTAGRFLGAVEHAYGSGHRRTAEINLVFEVDIPSLRPGKVVVSKEDYIEFVWVPVADLSRSHLEPAVLRRILRDWIAATTGPERWASTMAAKRQRRLKGCGLRVT